MTTGNHSDEAVTVACEAAYARGLADGAAAERAGLLAAAGDLKINSQPGQTTGTGLKNMLDRLTRDELERLVSGSLRGVTASVLGSAAGGVVMLDSEPWTCRQCGGQFIGGRVPDDLCGPCIGVRLAGAR